MWKNLNEFVVETKKVNLKETEKVISFVKSVVRSFHSFPLLPNCILLQTSIKTKEFSSNCVQFFLANRAKSPFSLRSFLNIRIESGERKKCNNDNNELFFHVIIFFRGSS